ncbi:MAG: hypothetical protein DRP63_05165 [Planctomycetota bacterium]|nr:MAG: hypothetical protein DRP63_05165 [Planctomycetota bacterium]
MLVVGLVALGMVPALALVLLFLAAVLVVALLRAGKLSRFGGLYLEASADAGLAAVCLPFLLA